jgi:hypothetical protein
VIGLVACCKTKLAHAAPARDLYVSNLFRLSLVEAERQCEHVYVISAEHGLVQLAQVIEPYEKTMNDLSKEWRVIWGVRVWDSLRRLHPNVERRIVFYAGVEYVKPIRRAVYQADRDTFAEPMAGMQIGQRLAWLKQRGLIVANTPT